MTASWLIRVAPALLGALALAAPLLAAPPESARSRRAVLANTDAVKTALEEKGLALGSPAFIRIFKREAELELFVQGGDGRFVLFRSYPVCAFSGDLGPKRRMGDGQAPEGFYFVPPAAMNPASRFHLSFNLGYPNAFDRSHGRTGSALMVHGNCVSIGCYAMTDPVIEEIWTVMDAAFRAGQPYVRVHAFPFRLTQEALAAAAGSPHHAFWSNLKEGSDWFERNARPPDAGVRAGRYVFAAG